MDKGDWQAMVHEVSKSQIQLNGNHFHFFHFESRCRCKELPLEFMWRSEKLHV